MELYTQEIEAGNYLDFQVLDETISLFIKNIAIVPTKQGDSNITCYSYQNDQKIFLSRISEQYSPNVKCTYPVVLDGKPNMKLYFEGKGKVNIIGYSVVSVMNEENESMEEE